MPLFESILLLDERSTPGAAAWNMGMDEALVAIAPAPLLRVYRWAGPAVSFGYFLPFLEAEKMARGRAMVRRWTGGGIVEHGEDFTWSLIIPTAHAFSRMRPAASYFALHAALAAAMPGEAGIVQVSMENAAPARGLCMEAPAPGDLLLGGRKIAGAGQRRCRQGLLHQGSICGIKLTEDFTERLALGLSGDVAVFPPQLWPRDHAGDLVRHRYGTDAWLRKR